MLTYIQMSELGDFEASETYEHTIVLYRSTGRTVSGFFKVSNIRKLSSGPIIL